jgi:hypothetical protein
MHPYLVRNSHPCPACDSTALTLMETVERVTDITLTVTKQGTWTPHVEKTEDDDSTMHEVTCSACGHSFFFDRLAYLAAKHVAAS